MNTDDIVTPSWSTSSFGDSAETSPQELSALREHLDLCKVSHGRVLALRCLAETMMDFVAARFITSLVLVGLLIAVSCMVL